MADNFSINRVTKSPKGEYPVPGFHFSVSWKVGKDEIANGSFTEISGLSQEIQLLEYRDGMSEDYATRKIAGMRKDSNVTLKRGVFHGNNEFFNWWKNVSSLKDADQYRVSVTINLLGEDHKPLITWSLNQAWPVKIDSPSMKSDSNEVAIESIELTHEGLTMEHVSAPAK